MSEPAGTSSGDTHRPLGWALLIIGGLWAAVSALRVITLVWSLWASPKTALLQAVLFLVGLLPGLVLLLAGWATLRRPEAGRSPLARTLGYLFLTIGALWTLTTGGCSAFFLVMGVTQGGGIYGPGAMIVLALVVGAVITAPGALLLWAGLAMLRRNPRAT